MVKKSVLEDDRKFLTLVLPLLLFSVSLLLSYYSCNQATSTEKNPSTSTTFSTVEVIAGGVKIERNPSESKLTQLGVSSWPKWAGSPSKIPWTFKATETMYFLEGKVNVYTEGFDGFFEIGAGDLVEFPEGMKITFDVIESVKKLYYVEK